MAEKLIAMRLFTKMDMWRERVSYELREEVTGNHPPHGSDLLALTEGNRFRDDFEKDGRQHEAGSDGDEADQRSVLLFGSDDQKSAEEITRRGNEAKDQELRNGCHRKITGARRRRWAGTSPAPTRLWAIAALVDKNVGSGPYSLHARPTISSQCGAAW